MTSGETVSDLFAAPTSIRNKRILVKTIMHLGNITKGIMHFGTNAIKPSSNASTTTIFEVKSGLFKVTMNDQTRIVPEGCHFFVLAENEYEIENMSKTDGILEFTMTREEIVEPETTIMMGGNQSKNKDLSLSDNSLFDADDDGGAHEKAAESSSNDENDQAADDVEDDSV